MRTWVSWRELNRGHTIGSVASIFPGERLAGDTTGNSPGSTSAACNAIVEHLGYGRRCTTRTNQVAVRLEAIARFGHACP